MSDKKEKDLSAITTFSGSHIIRVLTDAGVSVKATFANVAKWIIESYASSSLAGSNQSVKSAIDSLNSKIAWLQPTNEQASSLSVFCAYIDSITSIRGLAYGYLTLASAAAVGLPSTGHYFIVFSNSENFKTVLAFDNQTATRHSLMKISAVWNTSWI